MKRLEYIGWVMDVVYDEYYNNIYVFKECSRNNLVIKVWEVLPMEYLGKCIVHAFVRTEADISDNSFPASVIGIILTYFSI